MTEFLVRHFVKDYEAVEKSAVRTAYGVLASMVGIVCNVFLFLVKFIVGLLLHSVSVTADAFNNLSDAASSIISFIGVKMAGKPADKEHPFGHGRIEYIAALIVSFLVLEVGFTFLKDSVSKIRTPETLNFQLISVVILILSICVKFWLSAFNRKLGKRINSKVMLATAADAMGDVVTTGAAALSLLVFGLWNVNIDGITGLMVSAAVLFAGYNIAKDTLAPLIGEAIPPEVYEEISSFVEGFDGILGTHDLIVHNYGPSKSMASIHAEVSAGAEIAEYHAIVDRIEREAARKMGLLLVIHMDPVETDNERLNTYRKMLENVLADVDVRLSFHDFRMVGKDKNVCLIFDLVIPREYKDGAVGKLRTRISNEMRRRDPDCRCAITVENSYRSEEGVK